LAFGFGVVARPGFFVTDAEAGRVDLTHDARIVGIALEQFFGDESRPFGAFERVGMISQCKPHVCEVEQEQYFNLRDLRGLFAFGEVCQRHLGVSKEQFRIFCR